jgi:hypothetical protein
LITSALTSRPLLRLALDPAEKISISIAMRSSIKGGIGFDLCRGNATPPPEHRAEVADIAWSAVCQVPLLPRIRLVDERPLSGYSASGLSSKSREGLSFLSVQPVLCSITTFCVIST